MDTDGRHREAAARQDNLKSQTDVTLINKTSIIKLQDRKTSTVHCEKRKLVLGMKLLAPL